MFKLIKYFLSKPLDEKVEYDSKSIYDGHHRVTYKGVKALCSPFDFILYQMIVFELQPDLIVEIGTSSGGGALYLADLLDHLGKGMVHAIDIKKQSNQLLSEHPRIKLFTEGWKNYDINEAKIFSTILVIDDASHIYEDTLHAMLKFAPLVTPGSYLIVEDGIINELGMKEQYDGGPLRAIREFLKLNDNFIVDRYWCDFFGKNATFNVNGYLKKIKN